MQLLKIRIYNHVGDHRDVDFKPGQLNIITGQSTTGKSALLTIVDYCLGRDRPTVPTTSIFSAIAWYLVMWEFADGTRIVSGRRAVRAASNSRAYIQVGGPSLQMPAFDGLTENVDSDNLRIQLGSRIGLDNVTLDPREYGTRGPRAVGLGTAALFCLQEQEEIATKSTLFHRQADDGITLDLKDTFPFFLGAVGGDQAEQREALRAAKRALRKIDAVVSRANDEAQERGQVFRDLLDEAAAVGLFPNAELAASGDLRRAALSVVANYDLAVSTSPVVDRRADLQSQDARRRLEETLSENRTNLARALATRDLLLNQRTGEVEYAGSLQAQVGRLVSIDLLPHDDEDPATCPVCQQSLSSPDATVSQLNARLQELRDDLSGIQQVQPRRAEAVEQLGERVGELRSQITATTQALDSARRQMGDGAEMGLAERQAFVRGRIDAILTSVGAVDEAGLAAAKASQDEAAQRVAQLEGELSDDDVREQTNSRLNVVGRYLGEYAKALEAESADQPMRLDISALTIVVDEEHGPVPLTGFGSGATWVGYHIAAHLALHRFFLSQRRPVPPFLMLDQPSQAHFQGDVASSRTDREGERVRAIFKTLADFATEHEGEMQIIVVDHARYEDEWFTSKVTHSWHDGEKLIPESWRRYERRNDDGA